LITTAQPRAVEHGRRGTVAALATNEGVLTHYSAGASRSSTVAATSLVLFEWVELAAALKQVADIKR
jgi:protein-tyrosine phosphatase